MKVFNTLALNIPELEPDKVERGHFLVKGIKSSKRLIVRAKRIMEELKEKIFKSCVYPIHYPHRDPDLRETAEGETGHAFGHLEFLEKYGGGDPAPTFWIF